VDGALNEILVPGDALTVDLEVRTIRCESATLPARVLPLGDLAQIVEAGGIFACARSVGRIAGSGLVPDARARVP
jgi:hypothetical protein